jgi:predicted CoA-binding protein
MENNPPMPIGAGGRARVNDPETVREILLTAHELAIVGLSSNPTRPSHGVARYLQSRGFHVLPVNPHETEVLGEKSYSRLTDLPQRVDGVVVFRRSEEVGPIVEEAIQIGARFVWMQEGVCHEAAAARALEAGLQVVMNRCMLKEHRKLQWRG